jgi:hypothetical protein
MTGRRVKRAKQKNFRLMAAEDRQIQRAARAAGLTDSQWIRLMVLAALGETTLLKELERVVRLAEQLKQTSRRAANGRKSRR